MNEIYPHTSPIILTDTLFVEFGGSLDNSTPSQRSAAYQIAEMAATEDIGSFLLPTTVTGTFTHGNLFPIITTYNYVHSVDNTDFIDTQENIYFSQAGTANVNVSLRNDTRGIVDISRLVQNCACHTHVHGHVAPYQVRLSYTAGLPTGTANQPNVLMSLVTYADLVLGEIIGFGNEAPGDIGVQEFSNQEYKEKRVTLLRTAYGSSARAQFAYKHLTRLRKRTQVGM